MTGREYAAILLDSRYADAKVVEKVGNDHCEVFGVRRTGKHKNAIEANVIMPGLGGVMVVEPDLENPPDEELKTEDAK